MSCLPASSSTPHTIWRGPMNQKTTGVACPGSMNTSRLGSEAVLHFLHDLARWPRVDLLCTVLVLGYWGGGVLGIRSPLVFLAFRIPFVMFYVVIKRLSAETPEQNGPMHALTLRQESKIIKLKQLCVGIWSQKCRGIVVRLAHGMTVVVTNRWVAPKRADAPS